MQTSQQVNGAKVGVTQLISLNAWVKGGGAWCRTAELRDQADSETPRRLPPATYLLHGTGCAQEDDPLLREGRQWRDLSFARAP